MEDLTNSKNGIDSYVDKVLFIYRDSYYNKCNKSNITELIIAKDGAECRKTANIQWIPEYLKFSNELEKDQKNTIDKLIQLLYSNCII